MDQLDKPVMFLATTDAPRARRFYETTLGFRCIGDEPWALRFVVGGSILNIQKVPQVVAGPYTQLGWTVDDIVQTVAALKQRGITFERYEQMPQDEEGIMNMYGQAKVAWFKDPDGHTLSLTQVLAR